MWTRWDWDGTGTMRTVEDGDKFLSPCSSLMLGPQKLGALVPSTFWFRRVIRPLETYPTCVTMPTSVVRGQTVWALVGLRKIWECWTRPFGYECGLAGPQKYEYVNPLGGLCRIRSIYVKRYRYTSRFQIFGNAR